jgi:hypothetical protein
MSEFLAGKLGNSTTPNWKGIYGNFVVDGNSTFQQMQDLFYEKDFSKVEINKLYDLTYRLGRGFCLKVHGLDNNLIITTKEKNIRAYIVHDSTDSYISANRDEETLIKLGVEKDEYDYKIYDLKYEILDNTIYDGALCTDYRNQPESYGECNINALSRHIFSYYGCYPPWIKTAEKKTCEVDIASNNIGLNKINHIWDDLDTVTDTRDIDIMAECMEPCYKVQSTKILLVIVVQCNFLLFQLFL